MNRIIDFLSELNLHNDKCWFDAHKTQYKYVKEQFDSFVSILIDEIGLFDDNIKKLTVADCTYRIYRDLRFSPDKTPYKTHMGAYISPHGKNGGFAGYYFHIEPATVGFLGGPLLATGIHMPTAKELYSIREDLSINGDAYVKAMREPEKRGFALDMENALKRVPRGFDTDSPFADYIRLKEFCPMKVQPIGALNSETAHQVVEDFRSCFELNTLLNRCIEYAREVDSFR